MSEIATLFSARQREAVNRGNPTPLYHQLYLFLRHAITSGTLARGARMPTEKELADAFEVSRITSRRAMEELAREELVVRQPGKGTFVNFQPRRRPVRAPMIGMLQEIESIGRQTRARVLDCSRLQPPDAVRSLLGLAPGDTALYLSRLRHFDGEPFGHYQSWTVGVQAPKPLRVLETTPRMTQFRSQGLEVGFIRQTVNACAASELTAEILDLQPGDPVLRLTRIAYRHGLDDAHAVDHLQVLYHPGRFEYRIDLDLD